MKKTLFTSLLLCASLAASASAASYTVNSGSAVDLGISSTDIPFTLAQFDATLGTLTGVTVTVVQSSLSGSFEVTNTGATTFSVDKVTSDFRVRQLTGGLGYTSTFIDIDPLDTTPASNPSATINPSEAVVFDITASQGYTVADQSVGASFFAPYIGTGDVSFEVRNRLIVSVSGASFNVDSTNTITTTQMAITYTYDAIPEPSAALLGALGVLGLLRRRR
jgi:hypothetical protein